jgi:hypothetical protein
MVSKLQNFSEELYLHEDMINQRTKIYLAMYGQNSGDVKGKTQWTVDPESGPDQWLKHISDI